MGDADAWSESEDGDPRVDVATRAGAARDGAVGVEKDSEGSLNFFDAREETTMDGERGRICDDGCSRWC